MFYHSMLYSLEMEIKTSHPLVSTFPQPWENRPGVLLVFWGLHSVPTHPLRHLCTTQFSNCMGLQPTAYQSYKAMKFHLNPAMLHIATKTEGSIPETNAVLVTKPQILITCPFTEEVASL